MSRKLWQHQQYALDKYKGREFFGLLFDCGIGKGQPVTSQILTKQGFVTLDSLKEGDKVISPVDGKEYPVKGIFQKGKRHINKVSFSNKTVTYCDDEHLWNIQTASQRSKNKNKFSTVNMETLKSIPLVKTTNRKGTVNNYHNVYIPVNCAIHLTENDYTKTAYSVGLFIGDGCCVQKNASITLTEPDVKERYEKELLSLGFEIRQNSNFDYRIIKNKVTGDTYKKYLAEEGVSGYSFEKRIPQKYLFANINTRKKILEGLIDSDGTVASGGKIDYVTTSKGLIEDITFLVSSLGGVVTHSKEKRGKYKKDDNIVECRIAYRCAFRLPCELSLSKKHAEKLNKNFQRSQYKCIESIEDAGTTECVCIYIDSPDHLYITDNWIVTHNTLTAISIAEEKERPVVIIAPNVLCEQWEEEIEKYKEKDWKVKVITSKTKKKKGFQEEFEDFCKE